MLDLAASQAIQYLSIKLKTFADLGHQKIQLASKKVPFRKPKDPFGIQ